MHLDLAIFFGGHIFLLILPILSPTKTAKWESSTNCNIN